MTTSTSCPSRTRRATARGRRRPGRRTRARARTPGSRAGSAIRAIHRRQPTSLPSRSMTAVDRPRILVLNQYYWPGVEATAQLLSQLCEALAVDYDVTVVTGHLRGHDLPARETRNGVGSSASARRRTTARRSTFARRTTQLPRRHGPHGAPRRAARPRALHDRSARRGRYRARRRAALRRAAPRHQPGRVPRDRRASSSGSRTRRPGRPATARRAYLRRADSVVAIGETMKQRLEAKGRRPSASR